MDELEFTWRINKGTEGIDTSPFNPLSRAFRTTLAEGRPYISHSICLYSGERNKPNHIDPIRWLGIIVLSAGDRIIFFPGLSAQHDWIQTTQRGKAQHKKSFAIDHVSLDPSRQQWHFTTAGSTSHHEGGRTPADKDGLLHWFGMSISSEDVLRQLYKQTVVRFPIPPSDAMRRVSRIKNADEQGSFNAIGLSAGAKERFPEGFLHFCFTAGPFGCYNYQPSFFPTNWLVPTGSKSAIVDLSAGISDLQVQLHRISISKLYDVQIGAMWLPGTLAVPAIYTSPAHL